MSFDAALALTARGWPVFPVDHPDLPVCAGVRTRTHDPATCDKRGKHPACDRWSIEATTDIKELTVQFDDASRNIGIACGRAGLLVVDEDELDAFAKFAASIGEQIPATFVVRTGKGRHYYFLAPQVKLGNTEGPLKSYGMNIRGDRGYVVGPGSVHKTGAVYTIETDIAVAPCPDWLVAALTQSKASATPPLDLDDPFATMGDKHRGQIDYLHRYTRLVSYAGRLRAHALDYAEAVKLFRDRWRDCVQPPGQVPQARYHAPAPAGVSEPVATWESARDILTDVWHRYPAGDPRAEEVTGQPDDADADELRPLIDWHALFADDTTEEWIVEPLLPARRLIALYSAPKVGKSLLMLELAVGVARGTPVLGVTPDRPRRVLYVDFENDPKGDIRTRLVAMGMGPDDLANLCYLSYPTLAGLDSSVGAAQLLADVGRHRCEVVVIDTVSRAIRGDENENNTWLAFYRHTGLTLKQAGVAVIRLDHSGKDEAKGQRGGSAKSGDVDAVWRMSKVTEDVFRLDCEAARAQIAEKTLTLHRRTSPLRHDVDARGRIAAWDAKVQAVVDALDAAGLPDETGQPRAREVLKGNDTSASADALRAAIKRRRARLDPPDLTLAEGPE